MLTETELAKRLAPVVTTEAIATCRGWVRQPIDPTALARVLLDLLASVPEGGPADPVTSYGEQLRADRGTKSHICLGTGFACDEPTCARYHSPPTPRAASPAAAETIGQRLARIAVSAADSNRIVLAAGRDSVKLGWLESRSGSGDGYPITVLYRILAGLIDVGAAERDAAWRSAVAGSVPAAVPPATPADVGQCVKQAEENAAGAAAEQAAHIRQLEHDLAVARADLAKSHRMVGIRRDAVDSYWRNAISRACPSSPPPANPIDVGPCVVAEKAAVVRADNGKAVREAVEAERQKWVDAFVAAEPNRVFSGTPGNVGTYLANFADGTIHVEREACARVADAYANHFTSAAAVAVAIRART